MNEEKSENAYEKRQLVKSIELSICKGNTRGYGLIPACWATSTYGVLSGQWDEGGIFHYLFSHVCDNGKMVFKGLENLKEAGRLSAIGADMYYRYALGLDMAGYGKGTNQQWERLAEYVKGVEMNNPFLSPKNNQSVEGDIQEYWAMLRKLELLEHHRQSTRQEAEKMAQGITLESAKYKLWTGWNNARYTVPQNDENLKTLQRFMGFWDEFTEGFFYPDTLSERIHKITVNLCHTGVKLSWEVVLHLNILPVTVSIDSEHIDDEDQANIFDMLDSALL